MPDSLEAQGNIAKKLENKQIKSINVALGNKEYIEEWKSVTI